MTTRTLWWAYLKMAAAAMFIVLCVMFFIWYWAVGFAGHEQRVRQSTIREEVQLIRQCQDLGGEPWADAGGYVHCSPGISEVD